MKINIRYDGSKIKDIFSGALKSQRSVFYKQIYDTGIVRSAHVTLILRRARWHG